MNRGIIYLDSQMTLQMMHRQLKQITKFRIIVVNFIHFKHRYFEMGILPLSSDRLSAFFMDMITKVW